VEADPTQMRRVVTNLVDNARDAMPRGGRIVLSVRDRDVVSGDAGGGAPRPGAYVVLSVTDTGEGMASDVVAHIFEPFFTTRPAGHGTGLGLALVHGVVEEQSGHIEVCSALGEGTTVALLLPARATPAAEPGVALDVIPETSDTGAARTLDPVTTAWHPPTNGGATLLPADVLLVEDEESVLRLGTRILEGRGFRVRGATTGAEAITRLSGSGLLPDLVIADARLRDVDAATFVSAVRTVSPSIPVLLLSVFDPGDEATLEAPGVWVLPKPFTAGELTGAVRRALELRDPQR
jgi:CheY-like chemotaxis protein